jgi:hypothetical protein
VADAASGKISEEIVLRSVFALRVRAEPDVDAIRSLRAWLKRGLRDFGLRCLDIHQEQTGEKLMPINLNDAPTQRDRETIPDGAYLLRSTIIPGGVGTDGMLRRGTKNKRQLMLEFSHKVVGGEYDRVEIRDWVTVAIDENANGDLPLSTAEEHTKLQTSVRIGLTRLRAMLDSAFGLDPNDRSAEMEKRRTVEDYTAFDGLQFWAQIVTQAASGKYGASNRIDFVIVPGDPAYPEASTAVTPYGRDPAFDDEIPF